MAMRVYELSKKLDISSKQLLEMLQAQGFEVVSHMSVASDEAVAFAEKSLQKEKKPLESAKTTSPDKAITSKAAVNNKQSVQQLADKPQQENEIKTEKITNVEQKKSMQTTPIISAQKAPVQVVQANSMTLQPMTVGDFAQKANKPVSEVILVLLRQGVVAAKNQLIPEKVVEQLAKLYSITLVEPQKAQEQPDIERNAHQDNTQIERMPVVVVIGHVDHGKTTLLDFIRKTRIAAREKGGITQHLGAYEVKTSHGGVVFLDTPGHEAFSMMRARGIKVADIAILVVAADDGVMPQTVEAIKRAQAAEIPVIVAINKIDKASPSQIEAVKHGLTTYGLVPEEWGGTAVIMPISAKTGVGVDDLLEVLVLQAQLLELKTTTEVPAQGFVLESKIEKGLGPVGTVINQYGVLRVGDYFVAGSTSGKVSSLIDSYGKRVREAGPSMPVLVAGFKELPKTGDIFNVVTSDKIKQHTRATDAERIHITSKAGAKENAINIIVKTDNASSKEALVAAIGRLAKADLPELNIVHTAIGDISESDIMLARDTGSVLYGLHVKAEPNALVLAGRELVTIKLFDIIYKLLEEIEDVLQKGKPVKYITKKIGEAIVLKIFDIKGVGVIAGAQVKSGVFARNGKVVVYRGKQKVGAGDIKSLQRDKKTVKEVHAGFECAFLVQGFNEWQPDDRVECFIEVAEEPKN